MEAQTIFKAIVHIIAIMTIYIMVYCFGWTVIMKSTTRRRFTIARYLFVIFNIVMMMAPTIIILNVVCVWIKSDVNVLGAFFVLIIWAAGVLAVTLRLRYVEKRHRITTGTPVVNDLQMIFDEECEKLGLTGMVTIQNNSDVQSLQLVHWGKTNVIQCPQIEISKEDFRIICKYELYQVKHRNPIKRGFMKVLLACTWFNPISWHAASEMDFWIDVCCDAEVVSSGIADVSSYYKCLAKFVRDNHKKSMVSGLFLAERSRLLLMRKMLGSV